LTGTGIVRTSDEKRGRRETGVFPSPRFRAAALADRHVERHQADGIEHEPLIVQRRAPGFAVTRRGLLTDSAKIR
jgi:hypothetical protein